MRVLHLISGLTVGGAEMMLYRLLARMDTQHFANSVVCLTEVGPLGDSIRSLGSPVYTLGMQRGLPSLTGLWRLIAIINREKPDLLHTWMYHADLLGGIAAQLTGKMPVVWAIHNTSLDPRYTKITTRGVVKICAWLSRWLPAQIVSCSNAASQVHITRGYLAAQMKVIPNGFDLAVFKPDPTARVAVLQELGLPETTFLIGTIGRFDPLKDQHNFVQAAALTAAFLPEAHFLLCGDGMTWENPQLAQWIEATGIKSRFHLLGRRMDTPRLMAALDIFALSSRSEAFPLVLGEAMACAVACAVTDVGDSALMVGENGIVVPPQNPEALADGWRKLIALGPAGRRELGLAARRRIEQNYSLERMVQQYQALYLSLADADPV